MAAFPSPDSHGPRWLALVLLAVLLASRLLLIPGQPWEQDEALFSAAALDTDVVNHRPHPPGFPLWVGMGKLGNALTGDPVRALQLTSALASVATAALLGHLLAGLLGWPLGWAAALLYAFLPGVWFHAPRAFSTTPAVAAAVVAVLLWCRPGQRAWLAGCAVLGAAVLIRPPLAPPLIVLGAAAAHLRRERPAAWGKGAATATAVIVAGFAPLVADTGGLRSFLAALAEHASAHGGALHLATWEPARLGLVVALGGLLPTAAAALLAVIGVAALARHRPRLAAWSVVLLVFACAWLLLAHNRTYPRYTIPVLALAVGPVAAGLARLTGSTTRAAVVAVVAATAGACFTAPAMYAQVTEEFPPLAAMAAAQGVPGARSVLAEGLVSPFGDLLNLAHRAERPYLSLPHVAEGRIPIAALGGPWVLVGAAGAPAHLVPAPGESLLRFASKETRLAGLAQDRYLSAWAALRGGVLLDGASGSEPGPVSLSTSLRLLLQPTPPGSWLGLVVDVQGAPAGLELRVGGSRIGAAALEPGRHRYELQLPRPRTPRGASTLPQLAELVPSGRGRIRLMRIWVDDPEGRFTPPRIPPADLDDGDDSLVDGTGLWGLERKLGVPPRPGRWTRPAARLSLPAGRGRLVLSLCAPRKEATVVTLTVQPGGWSTTRSVGSHWQEVVVPVPVPTARIAVRLSTANPLTPVGRDGRVLGVVLGEVRFERSR